MSKKIIQSAFLVAAAPIKRQIRSLPPTGTKSFHKSFPDMRKKLFDLSSNYISEMMMMTITGPNSYAEGQVKFVKFYCYIVLNLMPNIKLH